MGRAREGGGGGETRSMQKSKCTALPRGPSQESGSANPARLEGQAQPPGHVSAPAWSISGGEWFRRRGGSGEQLTHRPPPEHRLPPWGPGCRRVQRLGTWEWAGGECRAPAPLRCAGDGGARAGDTAPRRGRCGGARGRAHLQPVG